MSIEVAGIVDALKESRKYKFLCDETLHRVASWAAMRSKSGREAAKRAKTKLHQVYGAYLGDWDAREVEERMERIADDAPTEDVRRICREIMFMHASTRERLQLLDEMYSRIFAVTGAPMRLLDIGCGFQPFALPWMNLPSGAEYIGTEIDTRIVTLANRFLRSMRRAGSARLRPQGTSAGGQPGATDQLEQPHEAVSTLGAVRAQDVLVSPPTDAVEVALLFKLLPSLEQQEKGCSERILRGLNAKFVVVSLPMRSLGGRDVGMDEHYRRVMDETLAGSPWPVTQFEMGHELFYVLDKRT